MAHHHGHASAHGHAASFGDLDVETAAFTRHWDELLDWVAHAGTDAASVVDLGAGNGVATIGLAQRLSRARLTAVDAQDTWFPTIDERAAAAGVADRVRTVAADLDDGLPLDELSAGLLFASNSLHHVRDAASVLRGLRDVATEDGVLCVVEVARPVRVLADDDPAAGAESHAGEVLGRRLREAMPLHGSRWARVVAENGWQVTDEREFVTTARPSSDESAGRYAIRHLERLVGAVADRASAADVALLDDALARARRDPATVSWDVDGSRIAVLARPARTADTR
ncbi:class I SAM-dependent methyltransferase [Williamsia sp. SKLECPSW1]